LKVLESRMLMRVSGPRRENVKAAGENYTVRSFVVHTLH
jgi:hypothetical protein